jgi:hypothetical protein
MFNKRLQWDKITAQFIKGGFGKFDKRNDFRKFIINQKFYAKKFASFNYTRNSKVTKWLRSIEQFEYYYPDQATYLQHKRY